MDLGKLLDAPVMEGDHSMVLDTHEELKGPAKTDFWLPVPMSDLQRTLTDAVVSQHYSDILKLFETTEPVMPESLETLYTNSQLVCSHPYLLVGDNAPHNLLLKDVPAQLARESGKFRVLGDVLDAIREEKIHVALFARPGKLFDLLEAFLLGRLINVRRYHGEYLRSKPEEDDKELSTVHIIPSSRIDSSFQGDERFDLIISFDQTFNGADSQVQSIRTQGRANDDLTPIIRFIAQNSVEHISLKFKEEPAVNEELVYLRRVLAAVVVLRGNVGELPRHVKLFYDHDLAVLSEWYHKKTGWPMPDLPNISVYSSLDVEKSLLTEVSTAQQLQSTPRSFYEAKRLKRDDHIQGSVADRLSHALLAKLNGLLQDLDYKNTEVAELRLDASRRQEAYEKLAEEMGVRVNEIEELRTRVNLAERRSERRAVDVERANEEKEKIQAELDATRELFKQTPDQTTLLQQNERIKELETELAKADGRLETRNQENEYTRLEYQRASAAAADAHSQIELLKSEKVDLERSATSNAVELRKLTFDAERQEKDEQIKDLNAQLELLQEQLRRVMDQEKSNGRSRLASRASSVPRNTMSPSRHSHTPSRS